MNHNTPMNSDRMIMGAIALLLVGIYFACNCSAIILIIGTTMPAWYSIAKEMITEKASFLEAVMECKIQIVISVLILIAVCISIE